MVSCLGDVHKALTLARMVIAGDILLPYLCVHAGWSSLP